MLKENIWTVLLGRTNELHEQVSVKNMLTVRNNVAAEYDHNSVMNFLYDVFGRYELQALLAKYDITGICSPRRFRFLARN